MARFVIKKLTDEQIISIVAGSDPTGSESQSKLAPVVGDLADHNWLAYGIEKGFYQVREIHLDELPCYRLFFHLNDQGWLYINAVLFIGTGAGNFPALVLGAERIAKELGAKGIEFSTQRLGLVNHAREFGYGITGVLMTKKI